jgi:hypothetical protein
VKRALSAALAPALVTVGFGVVLGLGVLPAVRLVAIWLLCLAALFLRRFVREIRGPDAKVSSRFDAAFRRRGAKASVPGELLRMERAIVVGVGTAGGFHLQLLPLVRTAAAARLASSYGIDLARSPAAARERLGDEAWDLVRPDRPAPEDRRARGVPRETVEKLIARVEAL